MFSHFLKKNKRLGIFNFKEKEKLIKLLSIFSKYWESKQCSAGKKH